MSYSKALLALALLFFNGFLNAGEPAQPAAFKHAGVIAAWRTFGDRLTFGKGQTLALVDDGCDLGRPEWSKSAGKVPKVLVAYDSVDGDDDPRHEGRGYHGSTIGIPSSLNYNGKWGVAFNNQLAVIRSLECCHCKTSDGKTVAAALQWIIDHHRQYRITTVNLAPVDDQPHAEPVATEIDAKLAQLRRLGIWVSAPTGNHNFTERHFLARLPRELFCDRRRAAGERRSLSRPPRQGRSGRSRRRNLIFQRHRLRRCDGAARSHRQGRVRLETRRSKPSRGDVGRHAKDRRKRARSRHQTQLPASLDLAAALRHVFGE